MPRPSPTRRLLTSTITTPTPSSSTTTTIIHTQPTQKPPRRARFVPSRTGPYPTPTATLKALSSTISPPPYAQSGWAPNSWEAPYAKFNLHEGPEIPAIRRSCHLVANAMKIAQNLIKPGITTESVNCAIHDFLISNGAYPSPLNYHGFPKSTCISLNEIMCHGIPSPTVKMEDGDLVKVDISCFRDGYHGDMCATFPVGQYVDARALALMAATRRALHEAIDLCAPGVPIRAIGQRVADVAREEGFFPDAHFVGHGLGHMFHMRPLIHHVTNTYEMGDMVPGMVFTIEPILMENNAEMVEWPDGWTATTSDGSWAAQFEHTILITDTGREILTV